MKIENIIQDIIQDTVDIKKVLALQLQKEKPMLDFTITLPELEKLSAIKVVELSFEEQQVSYTLRAEIHTQNGYRVFEIESWQTDDNIKDMAYDSLQKWFIDLLRLVIKKVKRLKRSGQFDQCVNLIN
ncbi:hypothetical protein BH11BAC3_BH11BAC3_35060 [soil metagenome]